MQDSNQPLSSDSEIRHSLELGIVVVNAEKRVVMWNHWMVLKSGISEQDALGKELPELFPDINHSRYNEVIGQCLEYKLSSVISHSLNKSPLPLFASTNNKVTGPLSQMIQIKPTNIGRENCCLIQIFDVSSSVSRDNTLREQAKNLKFANDFKTEFISNISHEIRTPLNSIIGFTERLLKNNVSDERRNDALEIIFKNGNHILQLVNDLLDISKIQAGQTELKLIELDLVELVESQLLVFSPLLESKDVQLYASYCTEKIIFKADYQRLEQILNNLISNAIKYTQKGRVDIVVNQGQEGVQFEVKDTGIGIAQESLPKLFSRFGSLHKDKNIKESAGLGLAITSQLVKLHGGTIEVQSELGKGSCFTVCLPNGI